MSAESSGSAGKLVTSIARLDGNTDNTRLAQVLDVEAILQMVSPSDEHQVDPQKVGARLMLKPGTIVLAADDSFVARSLIEQELKVLQAPYEMTKSGKEAWDRLNALADEAEAEGKTVQDKVALVLTDLEMPEMDGFTLTRNIKQSARLENLHKFFSIVVTFPWILPLVKLLVRLPPNPVFYRLYLAAFVLDGYIDTLHFDEAWLPHAAFHTFYGPYHAMGKKRPRPKDQLVFATQSTHKLLAGISQASQVLVQDAVDRKLDRHLFNEAYLMHTSTSPQYAIIASCDVAAAMMEAPGGPALVEESIQESLDFRRAMRKVEQEFGEKDWWFTVWGPDHLAAEGIGHSREWVLEAGETWHGFGDLAEGFNLLDPIKCTLITPGLGMSGQFAETGIPASIVTKFLAEHGVVVEKTGLYSFFIMFTIGITKGRWNTLLTALQQFKDDYDRNVPMWRILPEFCAVHPRYERMGLKDLCQSIHQMYARSDIARLVTEMYLSDLQPAMKPSDAFAYIARRQTERVDIDVLEGRITTSLLTPYPPGIPLLIPGERFNRPRRRSGSAARRPTCGVRRTYRW